MWVPAVGGRARILSTGTSLQAAWASSQCRPRSTRVSDPRLQRENQNDYYDLASEGTHHRFLRILLVANIGHVQPGGGEAGVRTPGGEDLQGLLGDLPPQAA